MIYKNNIKIKRNDTNNLILNVDFDDSYYGDDYIIIDIDLISTYIGRDIISDNLKSYDDEDIFIRVESISDSIRNTIFENVEEYLLNNFEK